jgi:hypothetical protein
VITNGSLLILESIQQGTLSLQCPILIQDSPKSIGMKVPNTTNSRTSKKNKTTSTASASSSSATTSLHQICDILGPAYPIHVIDVEHQEELDGWILEDLLEYWQDPECIRSLHTDTSSSTLFLFLGNRNTSVYQTDFIQSSP